MDFLIFEMMTLITDSIMAASSMVLGIVRKFKNPLIIECITLKAFQVPCLEV